MVSRHPRPWFNLELYPAAEELFYYLPPSCSGRDYQLEVGGHQCSVGSLLEELYQKTGTFQLWSLVRHMAGALEKTVEDLGTVREEMLLLLQLVFLSCPPLPLLQYSLPRCMQAATDLLVRQKNFSVGQPPAEVYITQSVTLTPSPTHVGHVINL